MKKKIPLAILEVLQPIADNNLNLANAIKDEKSMFHLVDKDENSDFYFKISKQEGRNGKIYYFVEQKPKDKENVNAHSSWLNLESVLTEINKWLELLQSYNKIHTIYDDPILKANQTRFEEQFKIIDEDADSTSFELNKQIFLFEYLNKVKSKLLLLQDGRSESQIKELKDLDNEASEIQNNLTTESKQKIIKRLSHLWAKAQKIGLEVIKEIFVSVATELTKQILIGK